MSKHDTDYCEAMSAQDGEVARAMLDQLFDESRLYRRGEDYKELLEFVSRFRQFAPFNAMLLHVQKPGLSYAASIRDWQERFGRWPKEGARPLLILRPFGPVALVYDVMDTEGYPMPKDVDPFLADGVYGGASLPKLGRELGRKGIDLLFVDAGHNSAGLIKVVHRPKDEKDRTVYRMHINRNHELPVQFSTLTHELGHLFLGHLGGDRHLKIPKRASLTHAQCEIEAESVAYITCRRNGILPNSERYLSGYISGSFSSENVDIYQVMRASGQVERLLNMDIKPQAESLTQPLELQF